MVIQKRDGSIVEYDSIKITHAINKAATDIGEIITIQQLDAIITPITRAIETSEEIQTVEDIQDMVEMGLMENQLKKVAKAYILYRAEKTRVREKGWDMTDLQRDILYNKYIHENEGFNGFIERVGHNNPSIQKLIREKKFLPAGRILMGRGLHKEGKKVTYSNCFVQDYVEDNIESIFDTAKKMARTYSYGGGVGINLKKLRPAGAAVNNAAKETTGAVSFMDLFSLTTGLISQKGRRGALMISLPVTHPDIEEFIKVKTDLNKVTFANISVMVTDDFMRAVKNNDIWTMTFTVESTGETIIKKIPAKKLMRIIAESNWKMAEPGMLFWDRVSNYHINDQNPIVEYVTSNPCGEKPLFAWNSCLLSSINLAKYVTNEIFNFVKFAEDVRKGIRYLDEVLEEGIPLLPLAEQKETVAKYRSIGLGLMGLADMFIYLGIKYGSAESLHLSHKIGHVMANTALQESALMAKELGPYPAYDKETVLRSTYLKEVATAETMGMIEKYGLRNAELLSIAPTGSISTMFGVSGGLEPLFNIAYTRESKTLHNEPTFYKVFTPIAKEYMDKHNITREEDLPDFFVTSSTLDYRARIDMQSVWQKYIDAAISSTVNVPNNFTVEEVEDMYIYAWEKGLKGVTLYRDGCERPGILTTKKEEPVAPDTSYITVCGECGGTLKVTNGCKECQDCGFSACSI